MIGGHGPRGPTEHIEDAIVLSYLLDSNVADCDRLSCKQGWLLGHPTDKEVTKKDYNLGAGTELTPSAMVKPQRTLLVREQA